MSGPMGEGPLPEDDGYVVPPVDDGEIDEPSVNEDEPPSRDDDGEIADQGTHFASNFGHWPRKTW